MLFRSLVHTLADMAEVFGPGRLISISRELTKIYEETLRLTLEEAIAHFDLTPPRGEFVLVVDGCRAPAPSGASMEEALALVSGHLDSGASLRDAVRLSSKDAGVSKNELYSRALQAFPQE